MSTPRPVYRKLRASERAKLRAHFLRLDPGERRLRFFGGVGDEFIDLYCERALASGCVVLGCFIAGELRAVGELHEHAGRSAADVAITVEAEYQDRGIGTEMLRRIVNLARNRLLKRLHLVCLAENTKMRAVAAKLGGRLKYRLGEVEARIDPPWPTYWSLMEEAVADGRAVLHTLWLGPDETPPPAANDDRPAGKSAA